MKKITLLTFFKIFCLFKLFSQCPSGNPAGPDKSICTGSSTSIGSSGTIGLVYNWYPTTGLNNASIAQPIANPTSTTTYTVTVSNQNLLQNGNFEGSGGFSTDYGAFPIGDGSCGSPNSTYGSLIITSNPNSAYSPWCNISDHTAIGTKMLAIDGSSFQNRRVWYRTVPVMQNTTYYFSGWTTVLSSLGTPTLRVRINGVNVVDNFIPPNSCGIWAKMASSWNSGASTTALIEIINSNLTCIGNDFALDDLIFSNCPIVTDDVKVAVNSVPPTTLPAGITTINYYNSYEVTQNFDVLKSSLPDGNQWYKNGVPIAGANGQTLVIQLTGVGSNSNQYRVGNACGMSGIVTLNYTGCNTEACYPVTFPSLPNGCITVPVTINAPNLGSGATYSWNARSSPSCHSFSPPSGTSNTTQLNTNFSCAGGSYYTDGIYTTATKVPNMTVVFYTLSTTNTSCRVMAVASPLSSNASSNLNDRIIIKPNPAQNDITIISSHNKIISIEIYDMLGKCLINKQALSNNYQLDISKLPTGPYNIKINTKDKTEFKKILISR